MSINILPLVTVITPTHNRAHMLSTAIKSVLNQSYLNFEHIIVNDSSTDNTENVIKRFKDSRIRYIQSNRTKGVAGARNIALKHAKGEWVTYIDDDNELFPVHLETMVNAIKQKNNVVFIISRGKRTLELYKKGKLIKEIDDFKNFPSTMTTKDIVMKTFYFDNNGFMHSRKVIEDGIFFDESPFVGTLDDWEFAIQLCEKYPDGLLYIKDVLFHYHQRFGTDGLVSNDSYSNVAKAFEYIYQKHKTDKMMTGQQWYPQRVEKYNKLQKDFEEGKAPPKYLLPFQN